MATDDLLLDTPPFAGETFPRNLDFIFLDSGFQRKGVILLPSAGLLRKQ